MQTEVKDRRRRIYDNRATSLPRRDGGACVDLQYRMGRDAGRAFSQSDGKEGRRLRDAEDHLANRRCDILKLKPADPLATEEATRFAHSIKIPVRCRKTVVTNRV